MEWNRRFRNKPTHLEVPGFYKGAKNILWKKDSLFNKWYWENWIFICRRLNLDTYFPYCTKKIQNGSKI
jgi:hypothetical protein